MTFISDGVTQALEWNRFIELAHIEALTAPGKALIYELRNSNSWASDIQAARNMQNETHEVTALLDRDALWGPLVELSDPLETLERLARGSVLELHELVVIRQWLYAIDSWTQVPRDEIRGERFKKVLSHLPDPYNLLRILDQIITPEGELSEKASPQLATLYSEIRALKRDIGNVLDQLLKTFQQKGVLQENFTDVRDGRYVIPIKISSQNEVEGIIYEASASRQTVFVEPKEVGSLNNRLRQRQNDLIQEIYRILEATSKKLQPFVDEIQQGVQTLTHWDTIQAKARLGRHYAGKSIEVTEGREFFLHQTAHPLLWWSLPPESIIRNEIDFGTPALALLLTGPNTGGKTVLLKTLGLAGICARTGFPFPATDTPQVPFFDSFYADLGDSQSIEQHLSSFSGHVVRFKEMLEVISEQSLILIDELNSATDPEEGSAFGRAVLETILSKNAMIVTTTHDPHLKALAIHDPRILNASMAFDEQSRTPTYRMILGVPGRSRALETAQRLGIPDHVIELAKKYISKEHSEFERLLAKLESDTQEAARARKEAVQIREEADRLRKEWTQRTETSVGEMLEKTRQKLRRILEQAQDEVRSTVRKLEAAKTHRELDKTRANLNEAINLAGSRMESALEEEAPSVAQALSRKSEQRPEQSSVKVEVGSTVRIRKWKSSGKVLEVTGTKVRVAMGTIQMTLALDEIEPLAPPSTKPPTIQTRITASREATNIPQSLDLRGIRFEEAMSQLEHYLDLAYRGGDFVEVTIVHGLGTGALREGTLKLLGSLPFVKNFRSGGPGQGGTGATVVEFERE